MNKIGSQNASGVSKPRQVASRGGGSLHREVLIRHAQSAVFGRPRFQYDHQALADSVATRTQDVHQSVMRANIALASRLPSRIPTPPPPEPRVVSQTTVTSQLHDILIHGDDAHAVLQALSDGADPMQPVASSNQHSAYFMAERYGRTASAQILLDAAVQKCFAVNAALPSETMDIARLTFVHTHDLNLAYACAPEMTGRQVNGLMTLQITRGAALALRNAESYACVGDALECERALTQAINVASSVGLGVFNDIAEIRMLCALNLGTTF